jgi:hypothetical protein
VNSTAVPEQPDPISQHREVGIDDALVNQALESKEEIFEV